MNLTYLDNAATTFPKPSGVIREVFKCLNTYCGNPGRSSHPPAMEAARKIYECRERITDFLGSSHPENVIFTLNATYALNMAIKGMLKRGDHVLISDMEHNSVLRPLERLKKSGMIEYSIFKTVENGALKSGDEILSSIRKSIIPQKTRMLICSHMPNICSVILPIDKIGDLCRKKEIVFVLDASQSAGHIPINVQSSNIDILCAPGHKGLFGIQGSGFMLLGENIHPKRLLEGGNGINSLDPSMPELPPESLEVGTLPTPSIVGLSEGISFLSSIGSVEISFREERMFKLTREALLNSEELKAKIYLPNAVGSTLLFNLGNIHSEEIGQHLSKDGICVRSGYHCSALGHRTLGTQDMGAVRISFSCFNRESDIDRLMRSLKEFAVISPIE